MIKLGYFKENELNQILKKKNILTDEDFNRIFIYDSNEEIIELFFQRRNKENMFTTVQNYMDELEGKFNSNNILKVQPY